VTRLGPGTFLAVVGASGVGKDSLLAAARERCGADVSFPRRVVTRPSGGGEDSVAVAEEEFAAARARGEFAVSWRAHGLGYGVPRAADDVVRAGGVVVVNVSRGVLLTLDERYERVVVVRVSVPEAVRAQRLHARGREAAADVTRRLTRPDPAPDRVPDHEIRNDGTVEQGAELLRRVIAGSLVAPR